MTSLPSDQTLNPQQSLILVVDDSREIRNLLKRAVTADGHRVVEAENGLDALAMLEHCDPDLVLMDVSMPQMDGLTACRQMKLLPHMTHVPIILITARDDNRSIDMGYEAGAEDYIVKPIRLSVLRRRVNHLIASKVAHRQLAQTHQRLQSLLEAAPQGVMVTNEQGRIVLINRRLMEMFGYSVEELLGQALEMLIPDRFVRRHQSHRQAYYENPHIRTMGKGYELVGKRKSGEEFPVEVGLSYVNDGENGIQALAFVVDISERKQLQKQLTLRDLKLQAVVEAQDEGLFILNQNGLIEMFNSAAAQIFGYEATELIGQPIAKLIPESYFGAHQEVFSRMPEESLQVINAGYNGIGIHKNGSQVPVFHAVKYVEITPGMAVYTGTIRLR